MTSEDRISGLSQVLLTFKTDVDQNEFLYYWINYWWKFSSMVNCKLTKRTMKCTLLFKDNELTVAMDFRR